MPPPFFGPFSFLATLSSRLCGIPAKRPRDRPFDRLDNGLLDGLSLLISVLILAAPLNPVDRWFPVSGEEGRFGVPPSGGKDQFDLRKRGTPNGLIRPG